MLHSGSRNIGNLLANIHIKNATAICEPLNGLEYLDANSDAGKKYLADMNFALSFAKENRYIMMEIVKDVIAKLLPDVTFEPTINIHHNYVAKEDHFGESVWVHRKGATHVTDKIVGIIPGSMGHPSYLVRGKNNADSFLSCSHGAGRAMSRKKAKGELNMETFKFQMAGVYSESVDEGHLDEAPDAYKSIGQVMANQSDLVEVITELHPILNIKG
jgi:tRNA-splicing ligase RtcB